MYSLMGGKWTSYRKMGEETVDCIVKDKAREFENHLKYTETQTLNFNLIGSYSKMEILEGLKQPSEQLFT